MKLRPRYKFMLDNTTVRQAAIDIYEKSKELSPELEMKKTQSIIHFFIPKKERKLWTPYLAVSFENTEEGAIVKGQIRPQEKIWLPFKFLYGGLVLSILAVIIYGSIQINLGHSSDTLWLLVPMIVSLFGLYLFSFLGQRKSAHCVLVFHNLLHRTYPQREESLIPEPK